MAKSINEMIAELKQDYEKVSAKANKINADASNLMLAIRAMERDAIGFLDDIVETFQHVQTDFDDVRYYLRVEAEKLTGDFFSYVNAWKLKIADLKVDMVEGKPVVTVHIEKPTHV